MTEQERYEQIDLLCEMKSAIDAQSQIKSILPSVINLRHDIHSSPELGTETPNTRSKVLNFLRDTSISLREPILGCDIIGELKGTSDRTIVLRADMDAVPLEEKTDLAYRSTVPNLMHACGHDGHTAMLAGTAVVLDRLRDRLPVNVRFVFQPGEEMVCAGRAMVDLGTCDGCDAAFALHGWPGLGEGCISTREGVLFAAGAGFEIEYWGKGCHGARPEDGNNPIPAAARLVERLQDIHERVFRESRSVVSVCAFLAGQASNIIPEKATVKGTARHLTLEDGDRIEADIRSAADEVAKAMGLEAQISYDRSYDLPVINSSVGYDAVRKAATQLLPEGSWQEAQQPSMAMEDFAFYLKEREGAMFWLGLGQNHASLHSPLFDFNDRVIPVGIMMLSMLALGC